MLLMRMPSLEATYEESKRGHQRPGRGGPVRVWKLPVRNPSPVSFHSMSSRSAPGLEATYEESKRANDGGSGHVWAVGLEATYEESKPGPGPLPRPPLRVFGSYL